MARSPFAPAMGMCSYETMVHLVDDLLSHSPRDRSHALFIIDHDTLDAIKTAFGCEVGDAILENAAMVLPSIFRATDLVARTYEDEFLVFVKDASSLDAIGCMAGLALQLLRCPCGTPEHMVEATVAVGIALAVDGAPGSFSDLFDNACFALRQAKLSRIHRFSICDAEGKPIEGTFGLERLVSASTPNMRPFLDAIDNGGVLLRAEPERNLIPHFFSDSFLALLGGMTRDEALRVYGDDMVAGVHHADRQRVRDEISDALATDTPLRTIARLHGANGCYVWVSISMNWVRDAEGRIDAFSSHTSVESLIRQYDCAALGDQGAFGGMAMYLFAIVFSKGKPTGFSVFDDRGRILPQLHGDDFAGSLVEHGLVHGDSEKSLRELYRRMLSGERFGGALALVNDRERGVLHWARISYTMTYDADGVPLRVSGSIRELPRAISAQGKFFRESRLFDAIGSRLLCALRADITAGVMECGYPEGSVPADVDYDSFVSLGVVKDCYGDDAVALARALSRENVMPLVEQGIFQLTREYRREDGGRIRWTNVTMHIVEDPSTHHLVAFLYVSDIERRYNEVAFASSFVRPDRVTGLYTVDSLARTVVALQYAEISGNPLAAVAVIRIAVPSDLRALLRAEDASSGQTYLGQQLAVCLAQEGQVAKFGDDGFLLLFPHIDSENWLRQLVERAIDDLCKSYVDKAGNPHPIVLACGYSTGNLRDIRFKDAVARAKSACRVNEKKGMGSVRSFGERLSMIRKELSTDDARAFRVIPSEELSRPLTGAENAALDEAMKALILSDDFEEGVASVLRIIGELYRAHRVFTVALMENGIVAGLHEWYEAGAQPIIGQIMGRTIKEYGALLNAANAEAPVVVERSHGVAGRIEGLPPRNWHFIAFPVLLNGLATGFVCIEDPHALTCNVAMLSRAVPLIARTRAKRGFIAAAPASRTRDVVTGLPNKAAFDRCVVTFDPTLYHSVGVVRVALDRSYTMEGERDKKSEQQSLLYAARNLSGMFPLDMVYCTGDLEITCVCTNLSYGSFNARATRMAAVMRQRSRSGYALCDAWSDDAVSLSKLLDEASTSVCGDRSILFPNEHARELGTIPSPQRAFDGGSFSIRLQPQVDLQTGEVVGSEALARCISSDGEAIPPSEFVSRMEAEGNIADLDYFVLEKALSTMEEWMERGLKLLPVSVNFSRQTIMDSSFVASVLAITSRYDVPEDMVEIEITESMGSFKNVELRMAMETLRGQGFRFALDDLGSEYSTLSTMSDLPFDTVKLDRMLVKRFVDDSVGRAVVEGIAHACEKNGIRCIAEGVEQEFYIKPLVDLGCHYGQGYCFARPMTVDQFADEYLLKADGNKENAALLFPSSRKERGDGEKR